MDRRTIHACILATTEVMSELRAMRRDTLDHREALDAHQRLLGAAAVEKRLAELYAEAD
jgi:hypothetical protein